MEKDGRRYESWIPVAVNSIGVSAYELKKYDVALDRDSTSLSNAGVSLQPQPPPCENCVSLTAPASMG